MLDLYEYPVMIKGEDIKTTLGVNLQAVIDIKEQQFINVVHSLIYDFLIYPTGNSVIKNRIINEYKTELEIPIKRALLAQVGYLLSNESDIGDWNGLIRSVNGVDNKQNQEYINKIISPKTINILMSTQPEILYAGGDE